MQAARHSCLSCSKPQEISRDHNVAAFFCNEASLDDWLKKRALKNHLANDSRVFVVCNEQNEVIGYYAICVASIAREDANPNLRRNAPATIPMALIARLAVRRDAQGQNIGPSLLRDAILRIAQASDKIAIKGIMVHALDEDAKAFYEHMGFRPSNFDDKLLMVTLAEVTSELSKPRNV